MSSYHEVTIIVEARRELLLFKQVLVRIEALRLALHDYMCPRVLDNVDETVVELRFIPDLLTVTIHLIINIY
jgi:hypothetical protein